MKPESALSRRTFLQASLAGGGLLLCFTLDGHFQIAALGDEPPAALDFRPNAFLRIGADGSITVIAKHDEMGQGIHTGLAMAICEELEVDVDRVQVEPAPADPAYAHSAFGLQVTGGSSSSWSSFDQMRNAGAVAREMLVQAAAKQWGIEPGKCQARDGAVVETQGKRRATYGELAAAAAKLPVPADVKLKDPASFTRLGKPTHRVDSKAKVLGSALFSLDVRVPGMLTALVLRAPSFGGKLKSFRAEPVQKMPGVRAVLAVPTGVAVIADTFWNALKARDALEAAWEPGPGDALDTARLREEYAMLAAKKGNVARVTGGGDSVIEQAARRVDAVYEVPFQPHAPMEPLSVLVTLLPDGGAELVTGSQLLGGDHMAVARLLGVGAEKVKIRNTYLGGGFGRRANPKSDFVTEAVQVAMAARSLGAPIKTMWTREDDLRGGWYRPMWLNAMAAGIDGNGNLVGWRHRIVGQSILTGTVFEAMMVKNGIDDTSVEGAADMAYAIPNISVELHSVSLPVPVQWWRSVGHSNTAFAKECFIDECAHAMGKDPLEVRRTYLAGHARLLGVLNAAAEKAGWGKPPPPGIGRGIAVHESFKGFAAHVAEVRLGDDKRVRVQRIVCAIDCGLVVNPDQIEAQLQGAAIFALSATLEGGLSFKDGRIEQSNFHDFSIVRMHEAPRVEVHIVRGEGPMGGIGEVGVPSVAPAVCNAIFALTGKRIRRLPIADQLG